MPLPVGVPGALWLCGKHAIGPDHERAIAETEETWLLLSGEYETAEKAAAEA